MNLKVNRKNINKLLKDKFSCKFLKNVEILIQELNFFLCLTPKFFYRIIIENKEILYFINYFLCFIRRQNENLGFEDYWYILLKNELYQIIFQVLYRLSLNWDEKNRIKNFEIFIHNNLIWDISRLFDLCVIYKNGNLEGVRRICEHILRYKVFKEDLRSSLKMIFKTFEQIRKDLFKKTSLALGLKKQKLLSDCIQNIESFLEIVPEFTNLYEPFLVEFVIQFEKIFPFLFSSKILEFQIQFHISHLVHIILMELYFKPIKLEICNKRVEFIYMLNKYMTKSNNDEIIHFNFSYLINTKSIIEVFSLLESNIFFNIIYSFYLDMDFFFEECKNKQKK